MKKIKNRGRKSKHKIMSLANGVVWISFTSNQLIKLGFDLQRQTTSDVRDWLFKKLKLR